MGRKEETGATSGNIKKLSKQLNIRSFHKDYIGFLTKHGGTTIDGVEYIGITKAGDQSDVATVTLELRKQYPNFPANAVPLCAVGNGDYVICINNSIYLWSHESKSVEHYLVQDTKVNGKLVSRRVNYFGNFIEKDNLRENYVLYKNTKQPSDEKIAHVEKHFGFRFSREYKNYLKTYGGVSYSYVKLLGIVEIDKELFEEDEGLDIRDAMRLIKYSEESGSNSGKLPKYSIPLTDEGDGQYLIYFNDTGKVQRWTQEGAVLEGAVYPDLYSGLLESMVHDSYYE